MSEKEEIEKRNYYELLGVERSATVEEIREAYREIARIYHPDSNFFGDILSYGLTERDNRLFQMVTAAYDTLIKAEKRAKYDLTLPPEIRDWDCEPYKDQKPQRSGPMREWNAPSSAEEVDLLRNSKLKDKGMATDSSQANRFSGLHEKVKEKAHDNFGRQTRYVQEMEVEKLEQWQRTFVWVASAFIVVLVIVILVLLF